MKKIEKQDKIENLDFINKSMDFYIYNNNNTWLYYLDNKILNYNNIDKLILINIKYPIILLKIIINILNLF